jgi:hypothetical protein
MMRSSMVRKQQRPETYALSSETAKDTGITCEGVRNKGGPQLFRGARPTIWSSAEALTQVRDKLRAFFIEPRPAGPRRDGPEGGL